jgi:transcription elongation factor S-II
MSVNKQLRENIINKLNKYIELLNISKLIESSIYNFSIEYAESNDVLYLIENIYENKYNEILLLLSEKNSHILNLLKNGKIDPSKLAYMKPEELNPEKYEIILKKKELIDYKKNNSIGSNAFTCVKCKKKRCDVTQKQMRAGDEPPTTFVTCLECGYTFKFN